MNSVVIARQVTDLPITDTNQVIKCDEATLIKIIVFILLRHVNMFPVYMGWIVHPVKSTLLCFSCSLKHTTLKTAADP